MRIDSSGFVGIATSNPQNELDVRGTVEIGNGSTQRMYLQGTGTDFRFYDRANLAERLRIDSSGNLLLASGDLYVNGSATGTDYQFDIGNSDTSVNFYASRSSGVNKAYRFLTSNTGASEAMRIDSSGNVGIGTSSPNVELEISGSAEMLRLQSTDTNKCSIKGRGSSADRWLLGTVASNDSVTLQATSATGELLFKTGGTNERMRITSGGNLGIGTNSPDTYLSGTDGLVVSSNYAGIAQRGTTHSQAWLSYVYLSGRYEWYNVTSSRTEAYLTTGGEFYNRSGTYGTISDSRLKQDIVDSGSQWDDIKALQVKKYRLNTDVEAEGEDAPVMLGVIAQDLEAAGMNGLVKESLQASTDEDGNIIPSDETYKTVKYSILYMKAVKALQEAMDRIETLEAKVAALENA
jgi:hypothetical protein